MSAMGTASLSFPPPKTTMNGTKYVALLRSKLQLHMSVHNCSIFMHDGAPCHRQGCEGVPGARKCASAGLAGQQPGSQPNRKSVEFDEGQSC